MLQSIICMYVCPAMRFPMLRGTGLKLGIMIGDGPPRLKSIFSKWPHQRSKVIQRSSCLRNTLWLPNLIGRSPDQGVVHCCCQRSCRGHPGVNKRSNCLEMPYGHQIKSINALWPPNLRERTPDQSVMHCWGQRSCRGQLRSTKGQIA